VGNHNQPCAAAGVLAKQPEQLLFGVSIKFAGRLVGQYDIWVIRQRYGQPGAGEFTAGQLRWVGASAGAETDPLYELIGTAPGCVSAGGQLGQPHVAAHVEMLQQVPCL
jgi:hypothetical protein